jgi:hypothetical protein
MRELFILIAHLLVTLAKLARPCGLGAVAAESLAVKHQLLIMKRAQRCAPKLTSWDRLALGVCALFVSPKRLSKMAVILKASTLLMPARSFPFNAAEREVAIFGFLAPGVELASSSAAIARLSLSLSCFKSASILCRSKVCSFP